MAPKLAAMKGSSSNNTDSTPVPVNKGKAPPETSSVQESRRKASDEWKEAAQVMTRMMKNSEIYSQMEDYIQDYTVQKERADRNGEKIKELETYRRVQIDEFAEKCSDWKEREKELERKVEIVEKNIRNIYSKEMKGLKDDLEATKKENLSFRTQLDTTTQDCMEASRQMEIWRQKVKRYEQDLAILDDTSLETHEEEAKGLRERGFRLFVTFFSRDVPGSILNKYSEWQQNEKGLELDFRLPPSNTPAAKAVRLAASLYIFASHLNKISSRSWYDPTSEDYSEMVAEVLPVIFKHDIRKKSLARSLFLSTNRRNDVQEAIRIAARTASGTVFERLKFFVTGEEQRFRSELDKLFQDWADFWLKMQYSKEQLEATLEDGRMDLADAWEMMGEFGDENLTQGTGSQSVPLFPCIYSPVTGKVIQAGCFLFLDQEQVVSANKEAEDLVRARMNPRRDSVRRRRGSMFISNNMVNVGRAATQGHSPT